MAALTGRSGMVVSRKKKARRLTLTSSDAPYVFGCIGNRLQIIYLITPSFILPVHKALYSKHTINYTRTTSCPLTSEEAAHLAHRLSKALRRAERAANPTWQFFTDIGI